MLDQIGGLITANFNPLKLSGIHAAGNNYGRHAGAGEPVAEPP
jgi:hypothetical protein